MNSGIEGSEAVRPRTALFRVGPRMADVDWEDGDGEDGDRYRMRPVPWRRWEAYGAALWVGLFSAAFSVWVLGRVVTPGGWAFWILVPLALFGVFIGLQLLMAGGAVLGSWVRKVVPRCKISEANWAAGSVLTGLTAAAVGMCWSGGMAGWLPGALWIVPAGMNAAAWAFERMLGK